MYLCTYVCLYVLVSVSVTEMFLLRWVSAATGLVSFTLFLPVVFRENYIAQRELETLREQQKVEEKTTDLHSNRPPLLPVMVLTYSFFSCMFNYVLLETLTSTLAMDQWAWKPQHAVERMGFITMGAGALGVLVFG